MRRTPLILLLLLIVTLPLTAALNEDFMKILTDEERSFLSKRSTFTVLFDENRAPLEYVEGNGQPKGVSQGYLDEISALTGIEFQIVSDPSWTVGLSRFLDCEIDMERGAESLERTRSALSPGRTCRCRSS